MTRTPIVEQLRAIDHPRTLYGIALGHLADDIEAGGPTAAIFAAHPNPRRDDALHLRLLAGVFRIVLRGSAPDLVPHYPCLGGHEPPENAWPALRQVLADHVDELTAALNQPPQTNEVGRSACLLQGLFEAVRRTGLRRIRLLEPGSSAGLNLNVDRYRFVGPEWGWGPSGSPLLIDTHLAGVVPESLTVIARRGCDLNPIDLGTESGRQYLTSFTWPWELHRHQRLADALDVAARHPVRVDRAPASTWLPHQLAEPVDDDVLTVVWTSITQQYWPPSVTDAVTATIDHHRGRLPLVHISMEGVPPLGLVGPFDPARHGPDTRIDGDVVVRSSHHGPPLIAAAVAAAATDEPPTP